MYIFSVAAICNPKAPVGTKDAIKSFNYDYSYFSMDVSIPRIVYLLI